MRRRAFLGGLGSVFSLGAARAQGTGRVYRIVVLSPQSTADMHEAAEEPGFNYFFRELRRLGYFEGLNLTVERRSSEGRTDDHASLVKEAVALNPDAMVVQSARLVRRVKEATSTVPVVAYTTDPIRNNLAESLARPGGNITGVTADAGVEVAGKRLELLRDAVPKLSRVGFLAPKEVWGAATGRTLKEAATRLSLPILGPPLESPITAAEYPRVFAEMAAQGADGVLASIAGEILKDRPTIIALTKEHRLPGVFPTRAFAEDGGLISYGPDLRAAYTRLAAYVDHILKGAKPSETPFYQQTAYELVVNIGTARALGLDVPATILARADEVIE